MKSTLQLEDTGGHYLTGEKITDGRTSVYLIDGEIAIDVTRGGGAHNSIHRTVRSSEAYLSVKQARKLRKHLKRLIAKAGE